MQSTIYKNYNHNSTHFNNTIVLIHYFMNFFSLFCIFGEKKEILKEKKFIKKIFFLERRHEATSICYKY